VKYEQSDSNFFTKITIANLKILSYRIKFSLKKLPHFLKKKIKERSVENEI